MKRKKLFLLSTLVVSTILGSTFAASIIRTASSDVIVRPLFTYTAEWKCNTSFSMQPDDPSADPVVNTAAAENIGLVPGEYKTDINVHNPSGNPTVTIMKKFVVSVPESKFLLFPDGKAFAVTFAGPDVAFFITCDEIQAKLGLPSGQAFKGFVILTTTVSNLDVVAEYTSEQLDFPPECPFGNGPPLADTNCSEGLALAVQTISAVAICATCDPGFDQAASLP